MNGYCLKPAEALEVAIAWKNLYTKVYFDPKGVLVMSWSMSFSEYLDRVGESRSNTSLEVGLWNNLASYLLQAELPKWSRPANCDLPVDTLLALSPEDILSVPHIGTEKAKVYKRLHASLKANPEQIRNHAFEISLEGLTRFSPKGTPPGVITTAWNRFMTHGLVSDEAPSIARLEQFCADVADGTNRPQRPFGKPNLVLLEAWLKHLKKAK